MNPNRTIVQAVVVIALVLVHVAVLVVNTAISVAIFVVTLLPLEGLFHLGLPVMNFCVDCAPLVQHFPTLLGMVVLVVFWLSVHAGIGFVAGKLLAGPNQRFKPTEPKKLGPAT